MDKRIKMKFKAGDRVKFLNEKGEGRIISILDKDKALVQIEDGFEIPVMVSELIRDQRQEEIREPEKKPRAERVEEEVFTEEPEYPVEDEEVVLAVHPGKGSTGFEAFLINSSSYHIYYVISIRRGGEDMLFANGKLEPDLKIELNRLVPEKIDENIILKVGLLFFGTDFYKAIDPVNRSFQIDPGLIYSGSVLQENEYLDEKAMINTIYSFKSKPKDSFENKLIDEADLKKAIVEKEKKERIKKTLKNSNRPDIEEVDLHIENIVDDFKGLSNGEILDIQMSRFEMKLETAIIHRISRIVFIHGVGNGKLKHEIRRTLDRKYPDLKYQDASFEEYGYGATLVIIPQKLFS